jgi:hypothetical protein
MSNGSAFSSEYVLQSTEVVEGIDEVTYRIEVYLRLSVDHDDKKFICKAYELASFPSLDAPGVSPALPTTMWKQLILPTNFYKRDVCSAMDQAKRFLAEEIQRRCIAAETSED